MLGGSVRRWWPRAAGLGVLVRAAAVAVGPALGVAGPVVRAAASASTSAIPFSTTGIAAGPDGDVWFTDPPDIGRITPSGAITEFALPDSKQAVGALAPGRPARSGS